MKINLPILVIPYEYLVREIDGAVLLAYEYGKKGGTTLIGQKQHLFPLIKFLKNSFWFLKSIVPGEIKIQQKILFYNGKIFSYDVEGLVPSQGDVGVYERINRRTLALVEKHFCWNDDEKQRYVKIFPEFEHKIINTGIPIQQSWENYSKKNNQTKTALLASSFPHVCEITNKYNYEQTKLVTENNLEKLEQLRKEIQMVQKGYEYAKDFLDHLIKLGIKVIIRPHPAEIGNIWESYINNPLVSFDDLTVPLAASIEKTDFVVTFNSTVAIQAKLMGKSCFQYFPIHEIKKFKTTFSEFARSNSTIIENLENFSVSSNKIKKTKKNKIYSEVSKKIINNLMETKIENSKIYNSLFLKIYLVFAKLKKLIVYLLSRQRIFRKIFPSKSVSPLYYVVGNRKAPIETYTAIKKSIQRMRLKSNKIILKRISNGLVEFKVVKK